MNMRERCDRIENGIECHGESKILWFWGRGGEKNDHVKSCAMWNEFGVRANSDEGFWEAAIATDVILWMMVFKSFEA